MQCPICKKDKQVVTEIMDHGDKMTFCCYTCGNFSISSSAERIAEKRGKSSEVSGWIREHKLMGIEVPLLTNHFLNEVIDNLPSYTPLEKQNKLLKAIELLSSFPGKEVVLYSNRDVSLAWANNEIELGYYIKSLLERNLIEISNTPYETSSEFDSWSVVITAQGWEHLDNEQSNFQLKTQAFVAMSFSDALLPVYENAIKQAIKSLGFHPYRVDRNPDIDRIDAKIIAEIKNSRFLVADVTEQKTGVYYEAGFAHGLGLPVIWCVRKDDLQNVHFDTRQYSHILWETEAELKENLTNVILAKIGRKRPNKSINLTRCQRQPETV